MKTENLSLENVNIFSCRESLLKANAELIDNLQKRVNSRRFRIQEGDGIKLGYVRALLNALQVQSCLLKDSEIDEVKREIEELKEALKCQSGN